jgi:cephalosporin-C deacetylase-like acetyl esterase
MMDSPKYSKFDVSAVTYKVVNGQDIKAYVLTPKNIPYGKHPIVAKFHGGFFVSSSSSHPIPILLTPLDFWQQPVP